MISESRIFAGLYFDTSTFCTSDSVNRELIAKLTNESPELNLPFALRSGKSYLLTEIGFL